MAKRSRILFDKTEIMCIYLDGETKMKSKLKNTNLRYDDIQSVSIEPCRERKGFRMVESERIIIRSSKLPRSIGYYKYKESPFFTEYKTGFRLFCKNNRITLYDEMKK